jgi:hypothetical protein
MSSRRESSTSATDLQIQPFSIERFTNKLHDLQDTFLDSFRASQESTDGGDSADEQQSSNNNEEANDSRVDSSGSDDDEANDHRGDNQSDQDDEEAREEEEDNTEENEEIDESIEPGLSPERAALESLTRYLEFGVAGIDRKKERRVSIDMSHNYITNDWWVSNREDTKIPMDIDSMIGRENTIPWKDSIEVFPLFGYGYTIEKSLHIGTSPLVQDLVS